MENRQYDLFMEDIKVVATESFQERADVIVKCLKQIEGALFMLGTYDKTGIIERKYGHVHSDYFNQKEFLRTICPPIFGLTIMADQRVNDAEYEMVETVLNRLSIGDAIDSCLSMPYNTCLTKLNDLVHDMIKVVNMNEDNVLGRMVVDQLPPYIYKVFLYLIVCDNDLTREEFDNISSVISWLEGFGVNLWPNR